ncbi:uncharacterized protein LOC132691544 [Panthera onca]
MKFLLPQEVWEQQNNILYPRTTRLAENKPDLKSFMVGNEANVEKNVATCRFIPFLQVPSPARPILRAERTPTSVRRQAPQAQSPTRATDPAAPPLRPAAPPGVARALRRHTLPGARRRSVSSAQPRAARVRGLFPRLPETRRGEALRRAGTQVSGDSGPGCAAAVAQTRALDSGRRRSRAGRQGRRLCSEPSAFSVPPSQAAAPPNRRRGNPESGARPRAGPPGRRVGPGAPPSRRGRSPSGSAGRDDVPGEPSRRLTRPRGAFVRFVSPPLRRPPASRRLSSATASRGCPDSALGLGGRVRFSRPSRATQFDLIPPSQRSVLNCLLELISPCSVSPSPFWSTLMSTAVLLSHLSDPRLRCEALEGSGHIFAALKQIL